MKYVGLDEQVRSNNFKSLLLLIGFPAVIIGGVYLVFVLAFPTASSNQINEEFLKVLPFVIGGVGVWFLIAFFMHSSMIKLATGAKSLERKENKRIYNLVENLCIADGMKMPKINVIETDALNAFASGITEKTYTVTLTRGIINTLDDAELEGVIAHELMHIKNKDVRLLIVSIIFVGIISFVLQIAFRSIIYGSLGSNRKKQDQRLMLVVLAVSAIAYLLPILFRFALSRKREYMADAGAAQMTKNPDALASALRKISGNHKVDSVKSEDVEQMFIENKPENSAGFLGGLGGLFATHPPIEKRIKFLEQL